MDCVRVLLPPASEPLDGGERAKDTVAFESTFESGYVPHESSIEYEGLYYQYQFETGEEKTKYFAPVFTTAYTRDPVSNKMETYVCVGMNSCLDGDGLKKHGGRPSLNLVIVVDISGSMSSSFQAESDSKLKVAAQAMVHGLLPQLNGNDRLSIVEFDNEAWVTQKMESLSKINIGELKSKLLAMDTKGGTTLKAGIDEAEKQIKSLPDWADQSRDNRIFFMTDMCPNDEDTDGAALFHFIMFCRPTGVKVSQLANERVYTTFVGIGVDFNTSLTKRIATIKACNYLSVQSTKEFKQMMNEQFDYLTTVNCLDVKITASSGKVNATRVFGSPGFEIPKEGVLCEMSSSYPSMKESPTLTQGGVMLVKIAEPLPSALDVTYTGRKGGPQRDVYTFTLPPRTDTDYYQGSAVRKAVLLTRYAALMKNYMIDAAKAGKSKPTPTVISESTGIVVPPPTPADVNQTNSYGLKRQPLDDKYHAIFTKFAKYFEHEADELKDKNLHKELKIVQSVLSREKK